MDLAVLAVKSARLEGVLAGVIEHGARAATIFDSCYLEGDRDPPLAERLGAMAREAGMPICGGNCMGYNNLDSKCYVTGYPTPYKTAHGGIAFITHSGTAYGSIPQADPRLAFNLVVSSGREMATTMADYMHYALAQDSTRVIALFLETVRDPEGFVAALERARERRVPVVVLKVGRTAVSARMAATHSGAIAGNDAAYQAVFERYGVVRLTDLYEMASTLALLSSPRQPGPGGLAVVGDSGGERGMLVDLASDLGRALRRHWRGDQGQAARPPVAGAGARQTRPTPGAPGTITRASSATASRPSWTTRTRPSPSCCVICARARS